MTRLPSVSGRKIIKAFEKIGYQVVRRKGSHFRLFHQSRESLSVPDHKIIGKGLLRKLLRDAEISVKEFIDLLKR